MEKKNIFKIILHVLVILIALIAFCSLFFPIVSEVYIGLFGVDVTTETGLDYLLFYSDILGDDYLFGLLILSLSSYLILMATPVLIVFSIISIFKFSKHATNRIRMMTAIVGLALTFWYMIEGIVVSVIANDIVYWDDKYYYSTIAYVPFIINTVPFVAFMVCNAVFKKKLVVVGAPTQPVTGYAQPAPTAYATQPTATAVVADAPAVPEEPIIEGTVFANLRGAQKVLNVFEDRIQLTQIKNFRSFVTQDLFKGNKEIYFADMTAVQFKPASALILGYIQFETSNIASRDNFGSENSWTFSEDMAEIAQKVLEYVRKKVAEYKNNKGVITATLSPADELLKFKSLLDAGVITQEEFDAKKKQLLGL